MIGVFHRLGWAIALLGGAMLVPVAIAAAVDEDVLIADYLIPSVLLIFVAGALVYGLRGETRSLKRSETYLLTVLAWTLVPLFAALPFMSVASMSLVDAYFEAVSGLTTTGASVIVEIDEAPRSLLFWRAFLQWLGGLATLVTAVMVLAPAGAGGLTARNVGLFEHGGTSAKARVANTLGGLLPIYAGATFLCIFLLLVSGIPALDAFCLAFSAVSTGGFMPRDGDLRVYGSTAAELVLMLAMLYGGTSFIWHRMLVNGRRDLIRHHHESYWVIGVALFVGFVYAVALFRQIAPQITDFGVLEALRQGLFTGVSLVTTTGLEARAGGFAALPVAVIAFFVVAGAASFSTAGGLKFYRVGGMLVQSHREIGRLIYPHGMRPGHFGSQPYDMQLMKAIWSAFALYFITLLAVGLVVAAEHTSFEGALLAALAAVGNNGPIYDVRWQGGALWPAYYSLTDAAKLALSAGMIAGRVELMVVLSVVLALLRRR